VSEISAYCNDVVLLIYVLLFVRMLFTCILNHVLLRSITILSKKYEISS